jgi:hypothetical protein
VADPFVLVSITASRLKGEIVYKVDCANTLTNEELEHYLQEITKAIVKWRSGACQPKIQSIQGILK